MSWKDIVAANERENKPPNLERVIKALKLLYGSRRQVIESNILGVESERDLGRIGDIDERKYIRDLVRDIRFKFRYRNPTGSKDHLKAIDALKEIYETL